MNRTAPAARRRLTAALGMAVTLGSVLALGAVPAEAASPPIITGMTVQGQACGAEPITVAADVPTLSGGGLTVTATYTDASWFGADILVAGTHVDFPSHFPTGQPNSHIVVPTQSVPDGTYTLRISVWDHGGGGLGYQSCPIMLDRGPVVGPGSNPLLGAGAVYAHTFSPAPRPAGGVGVEGSFVLAGPVPATAVAYEYAVTRSSELPTMWTRIPAVRDTVVPFVPDQTGDHWLHARALDDRGLPSPVRSLHFGVAETGQASEPRPVAMLVDLADDNPADGLVPASLTFGPDLTYSYGTIDVFHGDRRVASVAGTGAMGARRVMPVMLDKEVLGDGLVALRAEYRAFDGAPVSTSTSFLCLSCGWDLDFSIYGDVSGGLEVSARPIRGTWQPFVPAEDAGPQFEAGVEGVKMRLTGEIAEPYDISYRVHTDATVLSQLGWAREGEAAGSSGFGRTIDQVEMQVLRARDALPSTGHASFLGRSLPPLDRERLLPRLAF